MFKSQWTEGKNPSGNWLKRRKTFRMRTGVMKGICDGRERKAKRLRR